METNVPLDDPSMVRWFAEIVESDGESLETERKIVPVHRCTAKDKARFYPPNRGSKIKIEKLFSSNKMFCLDETDW